MTDYHVNINFDNILKVATRGVYRAAIFMGLGVHAATDDRLVEYRLDKFSMFRVVPESLDDASLAEAKANFRIFIEAAGLRELNESFAVFLDGMHWACLHVAHAGPVKGPLNLKKIHAKFEQVGLKKKFEKLGDLCGVNAKHVDYLLSINESRNCLTHRRGIVGEEDLNSDGTLSVKWLGGDFIVRHANGREEIFVPESLPIHVPDGGEVFMRFVERVREFQLGEHMRLATSELLEICFFFTHEAQVIYNQAVKYAQSVLPAQSTGGSQPPQT